MERNRGLICEFMKQRIVVFDIMRALSAIQIIILWHDISYFYPDSIILRLGSTLTTACLASFTFLSGLMNGNKIKSIPIFLKKRLIRLYIPYLISFSLLYAIGFINVSNVKSIIFPLTGISCFFGYQPNTLWFVSMLLLLYSITPIVLFKVKSYSLQGRLTIIYRSVLLLFFFFLIRYICVEFDNRLIQYYPFYIVGLLFNPNDLLLFKNNKLVNLLLYVIASAIIMYMIAYLWKYIPLHELFIGITGVIMLYCISLVVEKFPSIKYIMEKVAFASLFAYLFHRFFNYICIKSIGGEYAFITTLTMSVVIFPISYYLQLLYNKILSSLL